MKALATAATFLFAVPAGAQVSLDVPVGERAAPASSAAALDLSVTDVPPGYLWFDAPNTTRAGDARMRIVFNGREGAAALTPNQYWFYAQSYKRHLTRLSMRASVEASEAGARHLAFRDVALRYPNLRVEGFDLKRLYANALLTPDL